MIRVKVIEELDIFKYKDLISQGYKPISPWLEGMAKKFKYDGRLLSQEIFCSFIGSGDNVISEDIVKKIEETQVTFPNRKTSGWWFMGMETTSMLVTNIFWVRISLEVIVKTSQHSLLLILKIGSRW